MVNYFELMKLPQQYDIDITQLQQTMRQLQTMFHPDNHTGMSDSDHLSATPLTDETTKKLAALKPEQASAIINDAYNTLKNPDSRASHLLALNGISQSINQPIRDLDFLDEAMSFRIELEDADVQSVKALNQKLTQWLSTYEHEFSTIYQKVAAENIHNQAFECWVTQALSIIQKLQFLVKLQADVAKTTDELSKQDLGNDDDLYV